MEKKLKKSTQSNFEIELHVSQEDYQQAENAALKYFQKDLSIAGFRKGEVPLNIVKEKVNIQHLTLGTYEEIINRGIKTILDENKDTKFIGEPYDIDQNKKGNTTIISFKLDVYPEVEVKDKKREKQKIGKIDDKPTQEEMDSAIGQLKKNYAEYKDTDTIGAETISKIEVSFLNKEGEELHKTHIFVGEPEYTSSDFRSKTLFDKKQGETVNIKYTVKGLPEQLIYTKDDKKPANISLTIKDIKKVVYPDFTDEFIAKLFGKDAEVKTEKELIAFIEKSLSEQKHEASLVKLVEEYIQKVRENGINISIPKTMTEEEYKVRVQNLHQRFGGSKEKVQQFFEQMGEEKSKEFLDDIRKAAQESLEKFFVLRKVCEVLSLDINREKPGKLEIEEKLYNKLSS